LFKYGGDKLFLPVYFLSCVVLDKKGNTLETIQWWDCEAKMKSQGQ